MRYVNALIMIVLIGSSFFIVDLSAGPINISRLAEEMAADFTVKKGKILIKKRVAVMDFENLSPSLKEYNVGATAGAMLSKEFANSTIFLLVERKYVKRLLEEVELGMTGAVNPDTAVKAGRISGAEFIVMGSVSEVGENIVISARMISSETGEVISARNISQEKNEIIARARENYFSAFQSRYGISISISGFFLFPMDDRLTRGLNSQSLEVIYRFSKYFRFGIGYMLIGGNEIIRKKINMTPADYPALSSNYEIWRNYNFSGGGPKIMGDFVMPIFRWLNAVLRLEYVPLLDNSLEQDIADFPVWTPDGFGGLVIQSQRLLVTSWAEEENIAHIFNLSVRMEFLISKRLSFHVSGGFLYSTTLMPNVYEAGGVRHWSEDTDTNGMFKEYQDFNFARHKDGSRVDFNFTGFNLGFGLAIHF